MAAERNGRIIGVLLFAHLLAGLIVPYVFLLPLTSPPAAFLEIASTMPLQIRLNVLLLFLGGVIPVAISLAVWPVVRKRDRLAGLSLLALSVVNFSLQLIENGYWLTMLSVSQAYADAGAAEAATFQSVGIAIRSAFKWAHYSHILVVVGWLFAFYLLVFRCRLVPRVLAATGVAASVIHFGGIILPAFAGYSLPFAAIFGIPLALAGALIAVWLIAKGFSTSSVSTNSQRP
jgi:hypothetical protein